MSISSLLLTALLTGCGPAPADSSAAALTARLWSSTVDVWLHQALWTDPFRYDAGHALMVPLHAAFAVGREDWQGAFARHFQLSVHAEPRPILTAANELSWLQYLYLSSRFAVLAARAGQTHLIPAGLVPRLYYVVHRQWTEAPAWAWDGDAFPGGMHQRLAWKLSVEHTARRYYSAIIDPELYLFAIAADLRHYERLTATRGPFAGELSEVLTTAKQVFAQRAVWQPAGGWLFQPGIWYDHPDYQFAGRSEVADTMQPRCLPDVAEDASHSHRHPLWLTSLRDAYPPRAGEHAFYQQLLDGLSRQFFGRVLVQPEPSQAGFRTMNFMDGRNGVYGSKATRGTIYGPYGLSGTLAYGWWAFLASPRSRSLYRRLGAHRLTSTGPEDGSLHDRTLLLATYLASLL